MAICTTSIQLSAYNIHKSQPTYAIAAHPCPVPFRPHCIASHLYPYPVPFMPHGIAPHIYPCPEPFRPHRHSASNVFSTTMNAINATLFAHFMRIANGMSSGNPTIVVGSVIILFGTKKARLARPVWLFHSLLAMPSDMALKLIL